MYGCVHTAEFYVDFGAEYTCILCQNPHGILPGIHIP